MLHHSYAAPERTTYPVCILVPSIRVSDIKRAYLDPHGVDPNEVLVIDLHYSQETKKTPMAEMREYITQELAPVLADVQAEYVIVADSEYFKALTKANKVDANLGYVLDSEFGPWKVIYVPNFRQIFYDPDKIKAKIEQGFAALRDHRAGSYLAPGDGIIRFAAYPQTYEEIEQWMLRLYNEHQALTCDIETFSLKHWSAGIGTITFCWNKHEGIAFPVDLGPDSVRVRALLKDFFTHYKGKLIYHGAAFDCYVLAYQLFMKHILDQEGLLQGLEVMLGGDWDDTRLITYLATNSCAGSLLSLKVQAQAFSGQYALLEEDPDITKYPLADVLLYNLVDGLSTWYVHEKHWNQMVADDQLGIYQELFKPATVDIVQMQLTGMPISMPKVVEAKAILLENFDRITAAIRANPLVQRFVHQLREAHVEKRNSELKKKRISLEDQETQDIEFNPNSAPQLQKLLYEMVGLPVIALTEAKAPSTKADTLKALRNHTTNQEVLSFLDHMVEYAAVAIILETFIPAFEGAVQGPDGWHYLFGKFNLGGTKSGRLSSSDPNLQNIPANTIWGKLIKEAFAPPPGWLFVGLDFASLEDRISALTTKDPNKLKVYTDGYDGHSLRAFSYFGDQMPDIVDTIASINSVAKKYPAQRQDSKAPTFALTYQGTFKTLMTNCGFSLQTARMIEERYHELYAVSDQWVAAKLDEASRYGYITVAFGLRLRTPLLAQVIRGTSKTPHEAEAEGRTAGNALGQSWCLLNSRAWVEFMRKVRSSKHRLDIRPCAQIHDAGYALVRDDINAVLFTNEHLVKAVEWQEHPDIAHDEVKLGGELSIFYPNWSKEITIPNRASAADIFKIIAEKTG